MYFKTITTQTEQRMIDPSAPSAEMLKSAEVVRKIGIGRFKTYDCSNQEERGDYTPPKKLLWETQRIF